MPNIEYTMASSRYRISLDKLMKKGKLAEEACLAYMLKGKVIGMGFATKDGIRCSCHGKIFLISMFEKHLNIKLHKPAASIYEYDPVQLTVGKSLKELGTELKRATSKDKPDSPGPSKDVASELSSSGAPFASGLEGKENSCNNPSSPGNFSGDCAHTLNAASHGPDLSKDLESEFFDFGVLFGTGLEGEFISCSNSSCPEVFSRDCAQTLNAPDARLLCKKCLSLKSGQQEPWSSGNCEESLLCCNLCGKIEEKAKMVPSVELAYSVNQFCTDFCQEIFHILSGLVRMSVLESKTRQSQMPRVSWTLLRLSQPENLALANLNKAICTRLFRAVSLLEKSYCSGNTAPLWDALHNSRLDLSCSENCGFYTMLMEIEGADMSAIVFRIHGRQVAEMPFIVTCCTEEICLWAINSLEQRIFEHLKVIYMVIACPPELLSLWTKETFGFRPVDSNPEVDFTGFKFLRIGITSLLYKKVKYPCADQVDSSADDEYLI